VRAVERTPVAAELSYPQFLHHSGREFRTRLPLPAICVGMTTRMDLQLERGSWTGRDRIVDRLRISEVTAEII